MPIPNNFNIQSKGITTNHKYTPPLNIILVKISNKESTLYF